MCLRHSWVFGSLQELRKGHFQNPKATETLRPRRKHVPGLAWKMGQRQGTCPLKHVVLPEEKALKISCVSVLLLCGDLRQSNCGDKRRVRSESLTHMQTRSHAPTPPYVTAAWMDFLSSAGQKPFTKGNGTGEKVRLADFADLQGEGANGNFLSSKPHEA